MSGVDTRTIRARHTGTHMCVGGLWVRSNWGPCEPYEIAAELERAQAASEGVDMLIAQAERRGAVKALREAASYIARNPMRADLVSMWLNESARFTESDGKSA